MSEKGSYLAAIAGAVFGVIAGAVAGFVVDASLSCQPTCGFEELTAVAAGVLVGYLGAVAGVYGVLRARRERRAGVTAAPIAKLRIDLPSSYEGRLP